MVGKCFYFDGRPSRELGLTISGSGTYDAPERDITKISVPGRSGDLIQDNGRYKNVPVRYPVSILGDFAQKAEAARAWLLSRPGYRRLEDDYDPDHFRLAQFVGPISFDMGPGNHTGEATLTFDAKPQRYLKSGEVPLTVGNGDTVHNPTLFPASPLILISVEGGIGDTYATFTLGGQTLRLCLMGKNTFAIDCEAQDIFNDAGQERSSLLSCRAFPTLPPGDSVVSWEADDLDQVVNVRIVPRWWTV